MFSQRQSEENFFYIASQIARIILIVILVITIYKAYVMGWTSILTEGRGAWSHRATYMNQGLESLWHLNFVSIFLATSITVFFAWLLYILINKVSIRTWFDFFTIFLSFTTLGIYTVIRPDTPFNLYASRYFLPVLIPLIFLYTFIKTKDYSKLIIILIILPLFCYNIYFNYVHVFFPEKQGRVALRNDIKKNISDNSYVFIFGDRNSHRLLNNLILYDAKAIPIYIGTEHNAIYKKINEYISHLDEFLPFYLISDKNIINKNYNLLYTGVYQTNKHTSFNSILYPDSYNTSTFKYFIYEIYDKKIRYKHRYAFSRNDLKAISPNDFYPDQTWSKGNIKLKFPYTLSDIKQLKLKTHGLLKNRTKENFEIEISINGNRVNPIFPDKKTIVLKFNNAKQIRTLHIKSNTFVPKKLGINDDSRKFGLDLQKIVLKR